MADNRVLVMVFAVAAVSVVLLVAPYLRDAQCGRDRTAFISAVSDFIRTSGEQPLTEVAAQKFLLPCGAKRLYLASDHFDPGTKASSILPAEIISSRESGNRAFLSSADEITPLPGLSGLNLEEPYVLCIDANELGAVTLYGVRHEDSVYLNSPDDDSRCSLSPLVSDLVNAFPGDGDPEGVGDKLNELADSLGRLDNVGISREFVFDESKNATIIKLIIDSNSTLDNFTYYEFIPKCFAGSADEIEIQTESEVNLVVFRKDPILMWDFYGNDTSAELSYEAMKKIDEYCKSLFEGIGMSEGEDGKAVSTPLIKEGKRVIKFRISGKA